MQRSEISHRESVPRLGAPHVLSEVESLLRDQACPACRQVDEAERSFFSWFEIESFSSAEMHARLRSAMGLVPCEPR